MTFIVNQDGKVYQADLGPETTAKASAMQRFDPGKGWSAVGVAQVKSNRIQPKEFVMLKSLCFRRGRCVRGNRSLAQTGGAMVGTAPGKGRDGADRQGHRDHHRHRQGHARHHAQGPAGQPDDRHCRSRGQELRQAQGRRPGRHAVRRSADARAARRAAAWPSAAPRRRTPPAPSRARRQAVPSAAR